jgi:O-antigen ligase
MLLSGLIALEQRRWSPAQRARAFTVLLMVALVVLLAAPTAMVERATSYGAAEPTTAGRLDTYRAALTMFVEHPILGIGAGNFEWRNEELTGRPIGTHNSYLWALTAGGPVLLLLYLALFYTTHRTLRAVERRGPRQFEWLATALRLNLIAFLAFSLFAEVWIGEPLNLLVGPTVVLTRVAGARWRPVTAGPARAAAPTRWTT